MDYYCSPIRQLDVQPDGQQEAQTGAPRRKCKKLRFALLLTVVVILAVARVAAQVCFGLWLGSTLGEALPRYFDEFAPLPGITDEFYDGAESLFPTIENNVSESLPRTGLAPEVEMILVDVPEQSLTIQEVYRKVIPSIVSVQAYGRQGASYGTGVIMTADGYIVTNNHVIADCSEADVVLSDGTAYPAKLVGGDVESDLAVLKVEAKGLTPAEFGNSDALQVGDTALAIGNPLGAELFGTLTEGIVSAINRDVNVSGYTMNLIQTTAALNPGNSGGALVNIAGQVVGITNLKMMSDYETIEGLGFAIPTVWAKEVVDTLLDQGTVRRPTIGIMCFAIPEGEESEYGRESGIYVESVTPGGPAAQAGVQPGDVIIRANGRPVTTLEELTAIRDEAGVDGTMELVIWRDGQELETTMTLMDQYEVS